MYLNSVVNANQGAKGERVHSRARQAGRATLSASPSSRQPAACPVLYIDCRYCRPSVRAKVSDCRAKPKDPALFPLLCPASPLILAGIGDEH